MTRDDIIRMAHTAGLCDANGEDDDSANIVDALKKFAMLVLANTPPNTMMTYREGYAAGVAAEREECAQIADAEASIEGIAQRIAVNIRARGNT